MEKPVLAMTMGDPAGVGPELVLQAMNNPVVLDLCIPVVIGSEAISRQCAKQVGFQFPDVEVIPAQTLTQHRPRGPAIVDVPFAGIDSFRWAGLSDRCGEAAFAYVETAIDAALAGTVDAVTTGPLNKEALRLAGIDFPGHTEIFAERSGSHKWCMMQYSEALVCTFATVHCGYAEVPKLLTRRRVLDTIELTNSALTTLVDRRPKIVVCGLNPHAGENGLFGDSEEAKSIIPAVQEAIARGMDVQGPLPPDTAFLPSRRQETDAFVCMYHDQGHIPLKALAFDSAVNTTLGLPIIRTSVDHGTAFDIAWKGKADSGSLLAAIDLAVRLSGAGVRLGQ